MSPLSRESELALLRESLSKVNEQFFLTIQERRSLTLKIQHFKDSTGSYPFYAPKHEKKIFLYFRDQLKKLSIKELLAFSLIMEDQAQAFIPSAYPIWSERIHLTSSSQNLFEMINPLILKMIHPDFFYRLELSEEFSFLKDF
jgi:chorismate mutase